MHFPFSIFLPLVPFHPLSVFLTDTLGNCQMTINTTEPRWRLITDDIWGNGEEKKGQATRALISARMACTTSASAEPAVFPLVGQNQNKHVPHAGPQVVSPEKGYNY